MEDISIKIILPISILAIKVILKLVVGREPEPKDYGQMFLELPIDIIFLAISFTGVYGFLHPENSFNLIWFGILIGISALVILCSRISTKIADSDPKGWLRSLILLLMILLNYNGSSYFLYKSSSQIQKEKDLIHKESIKAKVDHNEPTSVHIQIGIFQPPSINGKLDDK